MEALKMRINPYIAVIIVIILGLIAPFLPPAQAARDGRRPYSRYRHRGYYPGAYFYYRRIYHPARIYYYYDVYPEKMIYYRGESQKRLSNPDYLSVVSIANMASQGIPDAVIISEIDRTRSSYILSSEIIAYLEKNKVSEAVIDYMLQTRQKYK